MLVEQGTYLLAKEGYELSLDICKNIRHYLNPQKWNVNSDKIQNLLTIVEKDPEKLVSESGLDYEDWVIGYQTGYMESYTLKRTEHFGMIRTSNNIYKLQKIHPLNKQKLVKLFVEGGLVCLEHYYEMFEEI